MKIEIKSRWNGSVLFAVEAGNLRLAVEAAVKAKADLSYADLRSADLSYADLSYANLSYANLRSANLSYADLRSADLRYADLRYANLRSADLRSADLSYADLRYANLSSADLSYAKSDFLSEVLKLPNELEFLRDALTSGKVDGSTYAAECACLAGTLAHAKGIPNYNGEPIRNGLTFQVDSSSPRELFFLAINKGDTPETNPASKIALDWTNEAIAIRDNIRDSEKKSTQP